MVESGKRFEMRVEEDLLERVDEWRAKQKDLPNRSEAARRLIERGLRGESELFSPGEKLTLLTLREMARKLDIVLEDPELDSVAEVIHGGHDWALRMTMPGVFHNHQDDPANVELVMNVLSMWDDLERSHDALSPADQASLAKELGFAGTNPLFPGFDGNHEAEHLGIARLLITKLDRFPRFAGRKLNSHMPTIATYHRMLEAFGQVRHRTMGGRGLTRSDLEKVLGERLHPERR